ncbi:MAG: sensor domain-containing diguanylate cyclase [Candidatus Rokubacteria bacterium]|nr:sensor domain-containing diguanylate cyclase [Candidatus Rokubacteria bacterium]
MTAALTKPDASKPASHASATTAHGNGAVGAPGLMPTEDLTRLLTELIQIGIALTSERDLEVLLERIVAEARRITCAEGGTLFLREGDELKFAVVQNDALARRIGERTMKRQFQGEPVRLDRPSVAGHVIQTGRAVNLPDVYDLPESSPYRFNWRYDAKTAYRTRSVLVVPLQEPSGWVLGALELINALDASGQVVPFDPRYESLIHALASQAAVAIRNTRLEELSFKDPLTDVYNRRYFKLRLEEEARRHLRFEQPLSLVTLDLDYFKDVNDEHGHTAGDQVLREVAQLLVNQSRSFTIVTRYGGDEFAILLANTPRAGAVTYAQRMCGVLERYPFHYGRITASVGVATLPEDGQSPDDLVEAADRALYEAKRRGRNAVSTA